MKQIMNETEEGTLQHNRKLVREWDKHCVRGKKVTDLVAGELDHFYEGQKLRKQMKENRRIVAEQLLGVSKVMEDFAKEIQRERENHQVQEEQIMQAFRDFGVEVEHVDIYCLDRGKY